MAQSPFPGLFAAYPPSRRKWLGYAAPDAPAPPDMAGPQPPAYDEGLFGPPISVPDNLDELVRAYGRGETDWDGTPTSPADGATADSTLNLKDAAGATVTGDPNDPNNPVVVTAHHAVDPFAWLGDRASDAAKVDLDLLGKLNAAPVTGLAAVLGILPAAAIDLLKGTAPKFRVGDNALQMLNTPFIDRPITAGNIQFYPSNYGPDRVINSYTGARIRAGDHEEGHSYRFQQRGVSMVPEWFANGGGVATNPLEIEADQYAVRKERKRP